MTCHKCGSAAPPYSQTEIGEGTTWHCPDCDALVPAPEVAPAIVHQAPPQAAKAQAKGAPQQPKPQPAESEPLDVIGAAKARVRWLKKELKRLGALQSELDKLTRLLDAAGSTRAPKAPKG